MRHHLVLAALLAVLLAVPADASQRQDTGPVGARLQAEGSWLTWVQGLAVMRMNAITGARSPVRTPPGCRFVDADARADILFSCSERGAPSAAPYGAILQRRTGEVRRLPAFRGAPTAGPLYPQRLGTRWVEVFREGGKFGSLLYADVRTGRVKDDPTGPFTDVDLDSPGLIRKRCRAHRPPPEGLEFDGAPAPGPIAVAGDRAVVQYRPDPDNGVRVARIVMRTCGQPDRILSTEEAAGRPVIDDRRIAWRVGAHLHIFDHRTGRHRIIRAPGGQPLLAAHRVFFRFGGRLMRLLP